MSSLLEKKMFSRYQIFGWRTGKVTQLHELKSVVNLLHQVNWKHDVARFGEIDEGLALLLQARHFVSQSYLLGLASLRFK
jgi:hypothetical protein